MLVVSGSVSTGSHAPSGITSSAAFDAAAFDKESGVLIPTADLAAVGSAELSLHRVASERAGDRGCLRAAIDLGAHGAGWHRREGVVHLGQCPAGALGVRVVAAGWVTAERVGALAPSRGGFHLND